MPAWEQDPAFSDFKTLAKKLEAAIAASGDLLRKVAGLTPEQVLPSFSAAQARLLKFDQHAMKRFDAALEEKRVVTLAHSSIVMTCILSAAVALSEFKSQPQDAGGGLAARAMNKLRQHSTNTLSLSALAWASFYAVMGQGLIDQAKSKRHQHKTIKAR